MNAKVPRFIHLGWREEDSMSTKWGRGPTLGCTQQALTMLLGVYYVLSHSVVSGSATPWTVALQAPLSMEFSRQEYWSGLLAALLRGTSQPRDQTQVSLIAGGFFTI